MRSRPPAARRSEDPAASELLNLAQDEGSRCFEAAGIEVADQALDAERRAAFGCSATDRRPAKASGGSSWQSLVRRTGNIEADWLNGEIVLLGRCTR